MRFAYSLAAAFFLACPEGGSQAWAAGVRIAMPSRGRVPSWGTPGNAASRKVFVDELNLHLGNILSLPVLAGTQQMDPAALTSYLKEMKPSKASQGRRLAVAALVDALGRPETGSSKLTAKLREVGDAEQGRAAADALEQAEQRFLEMSSSGRDSVLRSLEKLRMKQVQTGSVERTAARTEQDGGDFFDGALPRRKETLGNADAVNPFFPSGEKGVISLFSGDARAESRLAVEIDAPIVAIDLKGSPRLPGVDFHGGDVRSPELQQQVGRFQRVLLINPTLHDLSYSERRREAASKYKKIIFRNERELKSARKIGGDGGRLPIDNFALAGSIEFRSWKRLQELLELIEIAQNYLAAGGRVIILTELLDTITVFNKWVFGGANSIYRSDRYERTVLAMLDKYFPGIRIEKEPDGLKDMLWPRGTEMDNPWGRDAVSAWSLTFPEKN